MDYKKLQRNPKMVLSELVTRPDGSVVTKNGCKIYFPVRYEDADLAELVLPDLGDNVTNETKEIIPVEVVEEEPVAEEVVAETEEAASESEE